MQLESAPQTKSAVPALFRVKSLDSILKDSEHPHYQLHRALGPLHLTLLGIGAVIGAGIFATIGTAAAGDAARPGAGPALMLSFAITAVVCGFTALCYAEFSSLVPLAGSAYTYSYATLGELVAWIIGWDLIIEYAVGNIAVAISWANYFRTLLASFGIRVPDWLAMDYRTAARIVDSAGVATIYRDAPHVLGVPVIFNLLAVLITGAITVVLVWGIRQSARFNAIIVAIKLAVLGLFVVVGLRYIQPSNYTPFAPNGFAGISAGAAIVFFAYIGFDAVSTAAEETHNPQRNMPIGIIASLLICTIIYVIVAAVFTGLISYADLRNRLATEQAEPLTLALQHASPNLGWAVGIVAFGSVVAHTAVLLVFQLGQPRIFFSMSRDGLLPPAFSRVHSRFRTPHVATILTGVFVAAFSAFASLDEMVDLTNIGTLFAFVLVCSGTIVLRIKEPHRARPFRVPSGWPWAACLYATFAMAAWLLPVSPLARGALLVFAAPLFALGRNHIFPLLGVLSCFYLIYYLPPTSWMRFAAWLNLGFVIYVGYGSVHSRLTGKAAEHEASEPSSESSAAEHDARTSYSGAWLGVAGTGLLFFTRVLDLWIASRKNPALIEAAASPALLSQWLAPSWAMILPFLLNAAVLCPVVILRARRACARARTDSVLAYAKAAAGIAYCLCALILCYLALIVRR